MTQTETERRATAAILTVINDIGGDEPPVTSHSHTPHGSHTPPEAEDQEAEDAALLAGVRDGAWLDVQDFPPLRWAVPGLIPEGLTLLVGPPKAGKSWLLANLLLSIAYGGRALGRLPVGPARRVLYLALEDGDRRMQSRCRIILDGEPIPGLFHYKTTIPPGRVIAVIEAWMRRHPDTAMVVLDTLGKVMPQALQGESSYQRDYRIGSALKRVADATPGLSLVLIHHDRKAAAEDFVDAVSGTNGLAGSADSIVVLARNRKSEEAVLKVTGRDVPEEEYALRLEDGTRWMLDGDDLRQAAVNVGRREQTQNLGDTSTAILDYIGRQLEPVRAAEITDKFGKSAAEYLRRLEQSGRLHKPKRGLYVVPSAPDDPELDFAPQDQP
ncbi:AAA family ATPase [Actinomadura nitritigenes]|uniref:AAA family ATPase n=1 Tax=Actinomadura nitritigenes TaxID=134602 RepID=A0ABS3R0Q7_9ACTN|nr:AAA family ATPase [Actinomadura nitritigenes]MBO2439810.1 AAA family ATPase [Actinomadura nitritigenes]